MMETTYTTKQTCLKFCRPFYEQAHGQKLIFCRDKGEYNEWKFTLMCQACHSKVVRGFCSRSKKTFNTFKLESYNLTTRHWNHTLMQWCEPTGKKKSTIRELADSEVLNAIVNDRKLAKGSHRGVSSAAKQTLLVLAGHGDVTISAIKHATALLKVSPLEHINSYRALVPYYEQWKNLNPKLCYDIEPKNGGAFHRLTVVMPYITDFLPNMLNVFGLDAGFMPEIPIKGEIYYGN